MRVTNSMIVGTLLRNLNNNLGKMNRSQEQLSSGKRINRPSDDPVGLVDSLRMRTGLTELKQYKSNAETADSWLQTTDDALDQSVNIMQKIRELTVQGANVGTLPQISLDAIAKEVSQLRAQLVNIGNSTFGGKYIFSGTATQTPAFDSTGAFQGNTGSIQYEVGVGVTIPVNVDGVTAFGNMFTVIDNVLTDLGTSDGPGLSGQLAQLDSVIAQQLQVRSDIGARTNRIDFAINRMDSQTVNMTGLLSKAEDVDVAELITKLKMQENVYNASLSAGARIVQPTLMDFLR